MSTKLFVTKLSYKTTDDTLRNHFEGYGKIVWCQVVKDRDTGASKRYGFVTFENADDGEKALKELHNSTVDSCRIAVERSHQGMPGGGGDRERGRSDSPPRRRSRSPPRDGSPRKKENGDDKTECNPGKDDGGGPVKDDEIRLFIGGLPDDVHEDDLMELFKAANPVDAFVCRGKQPPCGFITLKNVEENINKAYEQDGIYFKNSKWRLVVNRAKPPRPKSPARGRPRSRSRSYDRRRADRGRSRSRSYDRRRGDSRDRHPPRRSRSRDRRRKSPSPYGAKSGRDADEVRLFVGGLPQSIKEDDVLDFFRKCEPIDAFIPRDKQKGAPYYGFVSIRNRGENVRKALAYDGEWFEKDGEHRLTVQYSKPRRKDDPYYKPPGRSPSPKRHRRSRSRSRGRNYSRSRSRY